MKNRGPPIEYLSKYGEVFVIRDGTKFLLYFPLKRKMALVNSSVLHLLKEGKFPRELKNVFEKKDMDVYEMEKKINPPKLIPSGLMLLPTYNCNLRCVYCYAYGGDKMNNLPWATAKAAIDFTIKQDEKRDSNRFGITFLGGGEPTLNWQVVTNSVKYGKKKIESKGKTFYSSISTNGVFSKEKAQWLSKNITEIQISFDGPKDIQNYARPSSRNGESYKIVFRNSKFIDKNTSKTKGFSIRSTIIGKFVDRMPEATEFFINSFENLNEICFEPVHKTGRYSEGICSAPNQNDFIKYFIEARKIGRKNNVPIVYRSANLEKLSVRYCGTPGRMFAVNPDGSVTSCNEICHTEDELADIFIYGKYNKDKKSFDIDMKKLEKLRKITLKNIKACDGCFAKYHCCGGCPSISARSCGSVFAPFHDYCKIVREILKEELFNIAESEKEIEPHFSPEMVEC